MLRAGRSFTEPAGLLPSSLTRMVLLEPSPNRCKRTRGVEPTKSSMVGNAIPALSNTDSRYCWPHNGDSRAEFCLRLVQPGAVRFTPTGRAKTQNTVLHCRPAAPRDPTWYGKRPMAAISFCYRDMHVSTYNR